VIQGSYGRYRKRRRLWKICWKILKVVMKRRQEEEQIRSLRHQASLVILRFLRKW
jgi:hypothetical protein